MNGITLSPLKLLNLFPHFWEDIETKAAEPMVL
jgi:hypothetical protein